MSPTRGQYVTHSRTLHDGTIVHSFSKELLAYLETLVAFCPYYRADDPRVILVVTAHIDKYFYSALEKYQNIQYNELHGFLTELLTEWYDKYPPAAAGSKRRVRWKHRAGCSCSCCYGSRRERHRGGGFSRALTNRHSPAMK
jgi:hypothetical protein